MSIAQAKRFTLDEYHRLGELGFFHEDDHIELINGEIIEKKSYSTRNSEFALILASLVRPFCRANGLPCPISGEAGTYDIQGSVVAPDFAYKRTPMSSEYPDPVAPEWAIEVISPTDKAPDIRKKRQIYIRAGILYWQMYPESESIDVYTLGQPVETVEIDGLLEVGDLIPGFKVTAQEIFAED